MVLWALRSVNVLPQFPCIAEKEGNKLVKENGFLYSLARAGERKVLRFCLPLLQPCYSFIEQIKGDFMCDLAGGRTVQPLLGNRVCFSSGPRLQPVLPEQGIPTELSFFWVHCFRVPLTVVPCLPFLLFNLENLVYSVIICQWPGMKILEICIYMCLKGECSNQSQRHLVSVRN